MSEQDGRKRLPPITLFRASGDARQTRVADERRRLLAEGSPPGAAGPLFQSLSKGDAVDGGSAAPPPPKARSPRAKKILLSETPIAPELGALPGQEALPGVEMPRKDPVETPPARTFDPVEEAKFEKMDAMIEEVMSRAIDDVRVFRIVEYVGPRHLVERQVARSIHGTVEIGADGRRGGEPGGLRITAVTLGEYPEVLKYARQTS